MAANEYYVTKVEDKTLHQVAHKHYGNMAHVHKLREANRHVHDPNNLRPGTKIVIPRGAAKRRHSQEP